MGFRTVVITNQCKLTYKNDYLIVRGEDVNMVHLSEISTLLIDTTMVSITAYLLCELVKNKIKVVFCDERRNPVSELIPYYGCHNSSKRVMTQITWDDHFKKTVWTAIVRQKIKNQAMLLKVLNKPEYSKLEGYIQELEFYDATNREGHAAKVYFNSLFGKNFCREAANDINAALNYGYAIILSTFNKEIVSKGYLTQLGIGHKNEFNFFNLSCDLMEPFRVLVDSVVYANQAACFDNEYKLKLVDILNQPVYLGGRENTLAYAIQIYIESVFKAIEMQELNQLQVYEFA